MERYIENGKTKIYLKEDILDESNICILLIHGFGEHGGRYSNFVSKLKEQGYSVFLMDLRGHGKTISKKGDMESINKVLKDVELVVSHIKTNYKFDKIGVFGHSTGGLVASLYESLHQNEIDFLVLSSPAVYCPEKYRKIKYIPHKIIPFIKLKKRSSETIENNENDKYSLKVFSVRTAGVIFKEGVNLLNKKINVRCPTLLVCGMQDKLLDEPKRFEEFFNKLVNENNKIIIYEDAKHRIVHNDGAEKRVEDILNWLKITNDKG